MIELYYWPGLPGRGEFVRLIFEQAGEPYLDIGPEQGIDAIVKMRQSNEGFAPPYIKDGDFILAQVPAISLYLGRKYGLVPTGEMESAKVAQLLLTVMDVVNEVHDTHHPINVALSYEEQKTEALAKANPFLNGRLERWLGYFDVTLNGQQWLTNNELSVADLSLFQLVAGIQYAFPKAAKRAIPVSLLSHHDRVAELPNIAEYLKSPRRQAFNESGIFRYYPELDI